LLRDEREASREDSWIRVYDEDRELLDGRVFTVPGHDILGISNPPPAGARLEDLESCLVLSHDGTDESRKSSGKGELGHEDHVGGREEGWDTK